MILIYISTAFILGILAGTHVSLPLWTLTLSLAPLPLILLKKPRKLILILVFCLLSLCGGLLRSQTTRPEINESNMQYYNNQGNVIVSGFVCADLEESEKSKHIVIQVESLRSETTHGVTGKLLVYAPLDSIYNYGDKLQVTGKLESPAQFDSFDYPGYLAEKGIYSTMSFPSIKVTGHGGFAPLAWIYCLRHSLGDALTQILPEPQASLAQGIILGQRGSIPQSVNNDFSRTGTTHILAISGQNLAILAGLIVAAGIWAFGKKRYIYAWLALGGVWFYALLTGMDAPEVRSAIMVSVFLVAEILGRQKSALTALFFA
ncbi:MAG TPA: ComEC family competence protein, partial [Dehalococcoidales bacterium]|nr:ComEC family competence protein [Dehalococcoidales bacterium]